MKKLIAMLLATVFALGLVGCGAPAAPAASPAAPAAPAASDAPAASPAADADAPAAPEKAKTKVALICGGAVNDGGWNAVAYKGLQRIESELGLEVAYTEKVAIAEMPQVARTYARQGYNLIFGHGAEFGEPFSSVAPEFPEVTFIPVNANASSENMFGTVFKFGELGYFCGMAGALVSQSGKLGVVAPDDAPNNIADITTYELGAKSINPAAEVFTAYTGSWTDLPKAKEAADSLISKGCDVLLSMGDAYSVGVFQACEESNIKSIGWVTDQNSLSPKTNICSGIQSVEDVYVVTAKNFVEGTLEKGVQIYGIPNGAQSLSKFYGLDEAQTKTVEDAIQAYKDGTLKIPTLY